MFHRNPPQAADHFANTLEVPNERKDRQLRWLVTLATVLMMGVASVTLSACDSQGTDTDQAAPPAVDDTSGDTTTTQ